MSLDRHLMATQKGAAPVDGTLRQALAAMCSGITALVDGDGVLRGVLTQGDVSRAMAAGHGPDEPVAGFMNASPYVLRADDEVVRRGRVWSYENHRRKINIPVVDEAGVFLRMENFFTHAATLAAPPPPSGDAPGGGRDLDVAFLAGNPKSGTTWLANLLRGHDQVAVADKEGQLLTVCLSGLRRFQAEFNDYAVSSFKVDDALLEATARDLFSRLLEGLAEGLENVRLVVEKTPQYNLCLPLVWRFFPRAKVVHVMRDGRDVVVSHWFNNLNNYLREHPEVDRDQAWQGPGDDFVRYSIDQWQQGVLRFEEATAGPHAERILGLRYEDLHADDAGNVRAICSFLGLDHDDDSVRACLDSGDFRRRSGGRKRGQGDNARFYRKGVVGDYANHLSGRQLEIIDNVAGRTLRNWGYA